MVMSKEDKIEIKKCILEELTSLVAKLVGRCSSPYESAPPTSSSCLSVCCARKRSQQAFLPSRPVTAQPILSKRSQFLPDSTPGPTTAIVQCCEQSQYKQNQNITDTKYILVNASRSRELRGGVLYIGCDCEKKNGLQDDCPRSECQGNPVCLFPEPECGPSTYAGGKHLEKRNSTTKMDSPINQQHCPTCVKCTC